MKTWTWASLISYFINTIIDAFLIGRGFHPLAFSLLLALWVILFWLTLASIVLPPSTLNPKP